MWFSNNRNVMKTGKKIMLYSIAITCILMSMPFNSNAQRISLDEHGMKWPITQAFPSFALPNDTLDGITITNENFTADQINLFVVLQGLVNRRKPSIIILKPGREGKYTWPNNFSFSMKEYSTEDSWKLISKYQKSIKGLVLYNAKKSNHYRNLAGTVAGLRKALPVTEAEYEKLKSLNINLPIIEDLSGLPFTTAEDIYKYLYKKYWPECTKRMLISHQASGYIRDIAAASGAAIVWLDPRKKSENQVLRLFLNDMKSGESIILGWWAEERSGIGIGTEYGISTVPADFYDNATVYAGMSPVIDLPIVPKKPKLENKIYISIFLSDGDNIQYCQHSLPNLWKDKTRGSIPINWTISPSLVDLGPGLLNYFYKTATPNDFFASGPSGLGYTLIYDAHNKKWNNKGGNSFEEYTKLTQRYLERSGLRVITVWDQINEDQMNMYANNCRYLYGVTQQDWQKQQGKIPVYVKQNKLAFIPNYPCYTNNVENIIDMNEEAIAEFDGSHPIFITSQAVAWKVGPDSIIALKKKLEKLSPGNIVICRADHFFSLYNEANRLSYNLTLSPEMKITSSPTSTQPEFVSDGTCSLRRSWISSKKDKKWIQFDFKRAYSLNRYVIRHAGVSGMDKSYNIKAFNLESSMDGKNWRKVDEQSNNKLDVTDIDFSPVEARYLRINIIDSGKDKVARIADVEVYGAVL